MSKTTQATGDAFMKSMMCICVNASRCSSIVSALKCFDEVDGSNFLIHYMMFHEFNSLCGCVLDKLFIDNTVGYLACDCVMGTRRQQIPQSK